MTDAEFIAWLKSPDRVYCMLAEVVASVGGVETTRYVSSTGYTTSPTDTPANRNYKSVLKAGGVITRRLSFTGNSTIGFSDLELDNLNGELDDWFSDVWANRSVKLYVGDMRWPRADFRLVLDGIIADVDTRDRTVLNIKVRDKLEQLNTAISETKLGGATSNEDRLIPLTFGEVHNVEPLLVSEALLKYQVHNGAMEGVIEVRDNGVPVAATPDLAAGTFTLSSTPAGTITCSVQGDKGSATYRNTVSTLVQRIATGYGATPLLAGDLDAAQLAAFETAHPQPVGRYVPDRDNVLNVCSDIAASVGAQLSMNALSKLQLLKIELPASGTPTEVTAANMEEFSLHVVQRIPVQAGVKLGYCRNWYVQNDLQTGIPPEHKELFKLEWLTATASNPSVATLYKIEQEPEQINTMLLVKADAQAEATRLLALWSTPRTIYGYTGLPELMLEQLGAPQTITHEDFGLVGGVTGQIVSVEHDWFNARVRIEVLA